MDNNSLKRINLFCGHYGSGKTNIAVNFALRLREKGLPVSIADIDIVNPYFRTKDSEKELTAAGVEVLSLPFANSNVDLPSLPQEIYGLVRQKDKYVVMDVGGDDRGAYALGRYVPDILDENNYDMFFVVNFYRPLTTTAAEAYEVLREIEEACKLPFTGIINNSNIGVETKLSDVLNSNAKAMELSELCGLPLVMTCADRKVCEEAGVENFFKLDLQKKLF